MEDKILHIKHLIDEFDLEIFAEYERVYRDYGIQPGLAAVLTSDDSGSVSYMKGIKNFCVLHGVSFHERRAFDSGTLLETIEELNNDDSVHGIMIMYPTPFDEKDTFYMNRVATEKDVEGLAVEHLGYLMQFEKFRDLARLRKLVIPPTAKGILYILKRYAAIYEAHQSQEGSYPDGLAHNPFSLEGKRITVVNDSLAVGRSLALMFLNENSSVQVCHRFTPFEDVKRFTSMSDIIVSAVPSAEFIIPADSVREGAVCIDISFEGNFSYPGIFEKAYKIAPMWRMMEKGDRINDMTLHRLISNLYYLVNSKLPDEVLSKLPG